MQFVVGAWIPLWQFLGSSKTSEADDSSREVTDTFQERNDSSRTEKKQDGYGVASLAGLLLGSAMVARGEIGLLIIEIGYNETSYVSSDGFITAVWAILLNTILGPVTVGYLVKFSGRRIGESRWGLQKLDTPEGRRKERESNV